MSIKIISAADDVTAIANRDGPEKGVERAIVLLNAQSQVIKHYRTAVDILRKLSELNELECNADTVALISEAQAYFQEGHA